MLYVAYDNLKKIKDLVGLMLSVPVREKQINFFFYRADLNPSSYS